MPSKTLSFVVSLSLLGLSSSALADSMAAVRFNDGWPSVASVIPNLPTLYKITSNQSNSFAIGLTPNSEMAVSVFDGANWQPATTIPNMKGVSGVFPFEGASAFALGNSMLSYFNGSTWTTAQAVQNFSNLTLSTSNDHAFAINTSPLAVSLFNPNNQSWGTPTDLSAQISNYNGNASANGNLYLIGLNAQGDATVLSSQDNQTWNAQTFNINRPFNLQIAAGGRAVLMTASKENQDLFEYSTDQGKTWTANNTWPGGMLFNSIQQNMAWTLSDTALAYFNLSAAHPVWMKSPIPESVGTIYTYAGPSLDGNQFCVVGGEDTAPHLACYSAANQQWQLIPSLDQVAGHLDMIELLNQNQIVGMGTDLNDQTALFYYNGQSWQVTHVQGLTHFLQNFYQNAGVLWVDGN